MFKEEGWEKACNLWTILPVSTATRITDDETSLPLGIHDFALIFSSTKSKLKTFWNAGYVIFTENSLTSTNFY